MYHILEEEARACECTLRVVLSLFWSFVRYLGPGSLLTYFHLCDSAWAVAALSDTLKRNERSSSSMAHSSPNHFPTSCRSALFSPSLPWFVPPCSSGIYRTEPWMQPASCCRRRYAQLRLKFHNHCFNILFQIGWRIYFNKTSSISRKRNVQVAE